MFRNYLTIAWRNLMKYKFISFINLFGLTIGLTCCMLILSYILNEISYDKFSQSQNMYRVERTFMMPADKKVTLELSAIAPPFAGLLKNDFSEIKKISQVLPNGNTPIKYGENIFNESRSFFADQNAIDLFDVRVTKGNSAKGLIEPNTIMVSEKAANKYFGAEDPINKVVRINDAFDVKVTGVYKDFPANSHMHPEILISLPTLYDSAIYGRQNFVNNFGNNAFYTYVVLPDNYEPKKLESQLAAFQDRHIPFDANGTIKPSDYSLLTLRKVTDIHLMSHKDDEAEENGDIKRVYIFSAIALFILLIACINYMNLATARSILRGKEIGIRKVVGATKGSLVGQFLSESVLLCYLATILALGLTAILLPPLNSLSGQNLTMGTLLKPGIIIGLVFVPILIGLLSGIYPAMFLSSFQPIKVLKGVFKVGGNSLSLRKSLVVFQFAISIILIICTTIVFQQMRYMQTKSLGINKDHIVTLSYATGLDPVYESFRSTLLADPNIKNIARSSRIPSGRLLDAMGSQIIKGDTMAPTQADIKFLVTDERYLDTYGVPIVSGRGFTTAYGPDTASFLINEAAAKILGLKNPEQAVGKQFFYGNNRGQLAGVFRDFHFESLHQRIVPLVMLFPKQAGNFGNLSVKLSGNTTAALAHLEKTWKKFLPQIPFDYTFLDERFENLYQSEQRQKTIFTLFACIAIFVACLGLFGLSAFAISQRVKEIGIRKVLGASTSNLVSLMSRDFLKLVLIAAIIAFPVAWFAMNKWLQEFAYRISIGWWVFILAGIIAAIVAFLTVGTQAVKAAHSNPVRNLRSE